MLSAAVFVAVALATTGIVRGSGHQIVDTGRYQEYATFVRSDLVPYRDFEVEYPPGALVVFTVPALLFSGSVEYFWAFAALMALAGGVGVLLTAAALGRLGRSARAKRWVLALLAISPVAFGGALLTRFDLVPAALVAGATLLLLRERPRAASVTLGVGAAVKLYPLVLLPLLVAWVWRRLGRREAFVCSLLTLGVVALAYLPFFVVSPSGATESVWRQLSRPLQIESLGSGVLVLLHHAAGLGVEVETTFGSQNLAGGAAAGVAVALSLATLAALGGLWLTFPRGAMTSERLVGYSALALVALVAFGKVLSPQFLIWLLFPLALVAGRRGVAAGACFAGAAIATALWFPWRYFDLTRELDPLVASLVTLRGVALVSALAILAWPIETKEQGS